MKFLFQAIELQLRVRVQLESRKLRFFSNELQAHYIAKELHHLFKLRGSQSQPDQSFDMHRIGSFVRVPVTRYHFRLFSQKSGEWPLRQKVLQSGAALGVQSLIVTADKSENGRTGGDERLEFALPIADKGFYVVIALATLIGLPLNFIAINPIRALVWSAIINGLAAAPVMCFMMVMRVALK